MSLLDVSGVVLNRREVREDSRLYTVFTHERGKVEVFGRGIRKGSAKLGGHLEPGATVRLTLAQGKSGETITAVERDHYPAATMQSLPRLASLGFILGLVDALTKPDAPDPALASFVQEAVDIVERFAEPSEATENQQQKKMAESAEANPPTLKLRRVTRQNASLPLNTQSAKAGNHFARFRMWFTWHVLGLTGVGPELDRCVHCRRELADGPVRFSALLGGWLGPECVRADAQAITVIAEVRDCVRTLVRAPWPEAFAYSASSRIEHSVATLTRTALDHALERRLPAERFVAFVRSLPT